jgi:hypothetical protein
MDAASFQLDYLPSNRLATQSASWWDGVLGIVGFERPPPVDLAQVPVTASMTPSLGGGEDLCEVWRIAGAGTVAPATRSMRQGRRFAVRFRDHRGR